MANVRDLKKDINYVLSDVIEAVYIWEYENTDKSTKKSEAIIDETIKTFDTLIEKVKDRSVEDKKAHFKSLRTELEEKRKGLIEKINKLG